MVVRGAKRRYIRWNLSLNRNGRSVYFNVVCNVNVINLLVRCFEGYLLDKHPSGKRHFSEYATLLWQSLLGNVFHFDLVEREERSSEPGHWAFYFESIFSQFSLSSRVICTLWKRFTNYNGLFCWSLYRILSESLTGDICILNKLTELLNVFPFQMESNGDGAIAIFKIYSLKYQFIYPKQFSIQINSKDEYSSKQTSVIKFYRKEFHLIYFIPLKIVRLFFSCDKKKTWVPNVH